MADVAALTEQLEALRSAYRTGATSISYEGKQISYRDTAGMQAAIIAIEAEIANATGTTPARNIYPRSTGWG
ncbi:phage head-tail joining protein [Bradyrhizobium sp.]|uniref:phage head-tail joining protein n=1 Tax=Bradyrhizobium sp. TaxID=376 RepID=UPI003C78FB11